MSESADAKRLTELLDRESEFIDGAPREPWVGSCYMRTKPRRSSWAISVGGARPLYVAWCRGTFLLGWCSNKRMLRVYFGPISVEAYR